MKLLSHIHVTVADAFIAEVCHNVNRAYCQSLGDASQPLWDEAPEWQKASAIAGVKAHLASELTPAQSHHSWMVQKISEGWTYGVAKDPIAKTHPCICDYEQLPLAQRTKDYLFKAVVEVFKTSVA